MELAEALRKADQILNEERQRPTVIYGSETDDFTAGLHSISTVQQLAAERQIRPRRVHESPDKFKFGSVNYELLLALHGHLHGNDRPSLAAHMLGRIPLPTSARVVRTGVTRFPSWKNYISELPLVAEFCLRVGYYPELVRAIAESNFTPGFLLLLMEVEDTVALNFNVLSNQDLEELGTTSTGVRERAFRKTYRSSVGRSRIGPPVFNREYDPKVAPIASEIAAVCDGIVAECRQASYWYLKGALQQNASLEVNQDRAQVESHLKSLGFSGPLLNAINVAEQDFRSSSTPFELKNCLGHLRSFLEGLHEQACIPIAAKGGTTAPKRWGKSTEMLRNNEILSAQEESLATALYVLISDEGVHPLMAEQEYARLLRNMVIEYGLMFLTKLSKIGIKLRQS